MKWTIFALLLIADFLVADFAFASGLSECFKNNKISNTEFNNKAFKLSVRYCASKSNDGTEVIHLISASVLQEGAERQIGLNAIRLKAHPRNRCDYLSFPLGAQQVFLGVGRISKACDQPDFGNWPATTNGVFDIPTVIGDEYGRFKVSVSTQTWRQSQVN